MIKAYKLQSNLYIEIYRLIMEIYYYIRFGTFLIFSVKTKKTYIIYD